VRMASGIRSCSVAKGVMGASFRERVIALEGIPSPRTEA
jgi:hypothetical protein